MAVQRVCVFCGSATGTGQSINRLLLTWESRSYAMVWSLSMVAVVSD